jgi:hypothetical protein
MNYAGMGTSLSFTSRLEEAAATRGGDADSGFFGMPERRRYAADEGWDELMLPFVRDAAVAAVAARQGATAKDASPRRDEAASDVIAYFDPSDRATEL